MIAEYASRTLGFRRLAFAKRILYSGVSLTWISVAISVATALCNASTSRKSLSDDRADMLLSVRAEINCAA